MCPEMQKEFGFVEKGLGAKTTNDSTVLFDNAHF